MGVAAFYYSRIKTMWNIYLKKILNVPPCGAVIRDRRLYFKTSEIERHKFSLNTFSFLHFCFQSTRAGPTRIYGMDLLLDQARCLLAISGSDRKSICWWWTGSLLWRHSDTSLIEYGLILSRLQLGIPSLTPWRVRCNFWKELYSLYDTVRQRPNRYRWRTDTHRSL